MWLLWWNWISKSTMGSISGTKLMDINFWIHYMLRTPSGRQSSKRKPEKWKKGKNRLKFNKLFWSLMMNFLVEDNQLLFPMAIKLWMITLAFPLCEWLQTSVRVSLNKLTQSLRVLHNRVKLLEGLSIQKVLFRVHSSVTENSMPNKNRFQICLLRIVQKKYE